MYKNYNIKKKERIYRYSRYCAEHIIITVRGLASFIEPDWKRLKKKIAKQFREADPMQQIYTRGFLDVLIKIPRTTVKVS